MYASARQVYGFRMVNAVGFAIWPSPRTLGWPFIVLAAAGLAWSVRDRRARSAAVLFAAIALQGAALIVTGLSSGAATPYLSLKMSYLAIYPLAVVSAARIASAWREVTRRPAATPLLAWVAVVVVILGVAIGAARSMAYRAAAEAGRHAAGVSRRRLGAHARAAGVRRLPRRRRLHRLLAAPGGARQPARRRATLVDDTFEPKQAIVRWILPDGLPYAIADHFDALPRDIREHVDVLARFGPAAVVQRRGAVGTATAQPFRP